MTIRTYNDLSLILLSSLAGTLAAADPAPPQSPQSPPSQRQPQLENVKNAWYSVGAFIAFVSLCHFVGLLGMIWRRVPPPTATPLHRRTVIYYRRLPAALMHTFRVVAFRWTLSLGNSYTLNVAEIFLTAAYIAILFSWSFVNCRFGTSSWSLVYRVS